MIVMEIYYVGAKSRGWPGHHGGVADLGSRRQTVVNSYNQ